MSAPNLDKLASRLAPVIRRGILLGDADSVVLLAIGRDDSEIGQIWHVELTKESDPDDLANEATANALSESEADGATRFRLDACHEGRAVASLVFRTQSERSKTVKDVEGEILLPKGEGAAHALVRQLMRHSENAHRIALGAVERREIAWFARDERMSKRIEELEGKLSAAVQSNVDFIAQERAAEVSLLEANAKAEVFAEGVKILRQHAPMIIAKFTGQDKLAPIVDVLRGLTAEQLDALVLLVPDEQQAKVREAWAAVRPKARELGKGAPVVDLASRSKT